MAEDEEEGCVVEAEEGGCEGEVHSRAPEGEGVGEAGGGGVGWVVERKSSLNHTDMQVSVQCGWVCDEHAFSGVFIARGKEDALVTRNLVPGESVYGEKRISVEVGHHWYLSPSSCAVGWSP